MKKRNKLSAILALLLAAMLLVVGCGGGGDDTKQEDTSKEDDGNKEENSGEVKMTDGYYYYFLADMGLGSFVHFNEDGTYYASYFDGAATDAGTYEVLDEELEYYPDTTGDDIGDTDGATEKASQVVALTSYLTGETQKIAYVDDALLDMSLNGLGNHRNLKHEADYKYVAENEENPIEIASYFANGSTGSAVTLSHNGSFIDAAGDELLEGTWEQKSESEYTLKYDGGDEGTLKIADDKRSAELTRGGETILVETLEKGTSNFTMSNPAVQPEGLPMSVEFRLDCADDGTCEMFMVVSQVSQEFSIDKGTYSISDVAKGTFNFETAGTIESTPDYESAQDNHLEMSMPYKAAFTISVDGQSMDLSVDTVLTGTYTKE